MSDVKVGNWNSLNSFGDPNRVNGALEVVKRMDADVLFIAETTILGDERGEAYRKASDSMAAMGYSINLISDYYPGEHDRPNQHTMSMWSRIGNTTTNGIVRTPFGNRYGLEFQDTESGLIVVGHHPDDFNSERRISANQELVDRLLFLEGKEAGEVTLPTVVAADFNVARSSPLLRLLRRATRKINVDPYKDDQSKVDRVKSLAIRLSDMEDETPIRILEAAGFKDADPRHRPTIGRWPLAFQLDRIMGAAVEFENFALHNSDGLSDHTPEVVVAKV